MIPCGVHGQEAREADGEPARALGAQAVHVLGRVYAGDQGHGVEPVGQRELDKEARDRRVGVQLLDERSELFLGYVSREAVDHRVDADLLAVSRSLEET